MLAAMLAPAPIAKALLAILLSVLAVRITNALRTKLRIARGIAKIPGPKGWPLVGILPVGILPATIQNGHRFHDFQEDMMVEHGGRIQIPWTFASDGTICIASPEDVQHILLTNFANYIRVPRLVAAFHELLGNGLLLLDHAHTRDNGAMWRLQRKVSAKVFTTNNFRLFSEQIFAKYAREIAQQISDQQGKCDMAALASQYALQSIFDVSCGVPLAQIDDNEDEDQQQPGSESFVASFRFVVGHAAARLITKPYFKYFWWCMPSEYRLKREMAVLHAVADKILARRLSESEQEIAPRSDIISLFVKKARELSAADSSGSTAAVLDLPTLRSIFFTFAMAGLDSTSSAVTYTFYALALYPEIQEKLFQEIVHETARDGRGEHHSLNHSALKKLPFLDAVVNEAMRVYTTVPTTIKVAAEDDRLPDGTFIPAGTEVQYTPWYMARHGAMWGEDPLVFRPERWLEMKTRPSAFEFPLFQAGPRVCPGMNMALTEVKLLVATLLREFSVAMQEGEQVEGRPYALAPFLTMAGGLPLQMTPRAAVAPRSSQCKHAEVWEPVARSHQHSNDC